MPVCPKCGCEIDCLVYFEEAVNMAELYLVDGEVSDFRGWDTINVLSTCFHCPECDEELFTDRGDAERFLRGEV